jgi:hypothetical protein
MWLTSDKWQEKEKKPVTNQRFPEAGGNVKRGKVLVVLSVDLRVVFQKQAHHVIMSMQHTHM